MNRRRAHALLALGLSGMLVAASVLVSSAAPTKAKGRCNARKAQCTTTETLPPSSTTTAPSTTTTTSTTVPADTNAPSATIASPTNGTTVTGGLGVTGTSTDDRGVARVEVRVDGGTWMAASGTSSWSMAIDTASWAPGSSHIVGARAVDTAGNTSAVSGVTVQKAATAPPPPTGDPSVAPATQGTWTSPEGVTIEVATAGEWTIRDIYRMLLENATAPGDFAEIAPTLTVKVQDQTASQTSATAGSSGGVYSTFEAYLYLKGVSSTFANQPDAQLAHEYGHVWTLFHLYLSQANQWSSYLDFRWANGDGSVRLADDARVGTSYTWDKAEIIADDYRLLFGSAAAIGQRPSHMNSYLPHPTNVPGLRDFFLASWAG